jgi:hypothetical protein
MNRGPGWPESVVAVFFIGFAGLALWLGIDHDKFSEVWAGVGTVVGIITGAIPGYFFAKTAQANTSQAVETASQAQTAAQTAQEQAVAAQNKLAAVLEVAPQNLVDEARQRNPTAW